MKQVTKKNDTNYLIIEQMNNFSFQKGFDQVPHGKIKQLKLDLMQVLKINSKPAWLNRLRGNIEPKVSEARAIEEVFAKYGIKEVWG